MSRRTMLASTTALCVATASSSAASRAGHAVLESCSDTDANRPNASVATVDRIVDDAHVVLLLEENGRVVDQLVVPRAELPAAGEGDRLAITVSGDDLESACLLEDEAERQRGRLRTWFGSLADRLVDSDG